MLLSIRRENMDAKMDSAESLKEIVREKYGQLARDGGSCCGPTSCCGPSNAGDPSFHINEDYSNLDGYVKEADLGLGCGIPIDAAELQPGQTVVDLGSGAGNDAFIARSGVPTPAAEFDCGWGVIVFRQRLAVAPRPPQSPASTPARQALLQPTWC
jgi:hypothetical protein